MHKFPSSPDPRPALTEDRYTESFSSAPKPQHSPEKLDNILAPAARVLCTLYVKLHLVPPGSLLIASSPAASTCVPPGHPQEHNRPGPRRGADVGEQTGFHFTLISGQLRGEWAHPPRPRGSKGEHPNPPERHRALTTRTISAERLQTRRLGDCPPELELCLSHQAGRSIRPGAQYTFVNEFK